MFINIFFLFQLRKIYLNLVWKIRGYSCIFEVWRKQDSRFTWTCRKSSQNR